MKVVLIASAAAGILLVVLGVFEAWRKRKRPGRTSQPRVPPRDDGFDGGASRSDSEPPPTRYGLVTGQVRAFTPRQETQRTNFYPERALIVWNFYLERYVGNERQMPIPVQMRGATFGSQIADGDEVQIDLGPELPLGDTARPPSVYNRTSGAVVTADVGRPFMDHLTALINFVRFVFWVTTLTAGSLLLCVGVILLFWVLLAGAPVMQGGAGTPPSLPRGVPPEAVSK